MPRVSEPLVLTVAAHRALDQRAISDWGVPGVVLMENAGRNVLECLDELRLWPSPPRALRIVCGKGNNAGDGLVIARHLALRGLSARVLLAAPLTTLSGDAGVNAVIAGRIGLDVVDLSAADEATWIEALAESGPPVIFDCLLGTGLLGAARETMATAIRAINRCRRGPGAAWVVAVDVPSGMDADTGQVGGDAVEADLTVTLAALKPGFGRGESQRWLGRVEVVDIGLPAALVVTGAAH